MSEYRKRETVRRVLCCQWLQIEEIGGNLQRRPEGSQRGRKEARWVRQSHRQWRNVYKESESILSTLLIKFTGHWYLVVWTNNMVIIVRFVKYGSCEIVSVKVLLRWVQERVRGEKFLTSKFFIKGDWWKKK